MTIVRRIALRQAGDVVRSRWVVAYTACFIAVTEGMLRLGGSDVRALLSIANVMLYVTPLVTLVFGTVYLYNAREFIEVVLAQPVGRRQVFAGLYLGLFASLAGAWVLGVGVPLVAHGALVSPEMRGVLPVLITTGVALTACFAAIATWIAVRVDDRLKGLGVALASWFALALLYDGAVLLFVSQASDRPIEPAMLALMALNPVDLARVLVLLEFDVAALLGYTGAVFSRVFAGAAGTALAAAALALWVALPLMSAARAFNRKDF